MAGWKKRLLERVEEAGIKEEKERIKEEEEKMTGWKDLEEEEEGKKKRKATTRGAAIGDAAKMKRSNPCKRTITLMMARIKDLTFPCASNPSPDAEWCRWIKRKKEP